MQGRLADGCVECAVPAPATNYTTNVGIGVTHKARGLQDALVRSNPVTCEYVRLTYSNVT
jgi:hypothetical protein